MRREWVGKWLKTYLQGVWLRKKGDHMGEGKKLVFIEVLDKCYWV